MSERRGKGARRETGCRSAEAPQFSRCALSSIRGGSGSRSALDRVLRATSASRRGASWVDGKGAGRQSERMPKVIGRSGEIGRFRWPARRKGAMDGGDEQWCPFVRWPNGPLSGSLLSRAADVRSKQRKPLANFCSRRLLAAAEALRTTPGVTGRRAALSPAVVPRIPGCTRCPRGRRLIGTAVERGRRTCCRSSPLFTRVGCR